MPSQQPLIAQGIGESYSIVPTPNQSLILDVELEDRPYVLGEPIWIRCSMINVTPDPVKIFYDLEAENHLMMDVRDSEGEVVPEIIQEKGDYGGHKIVTVAPGHRLVRVFSFLDEYRIKEPGDYQVTVRYESNGQVVERDPKTSKLVTKKATPCSLKKKLSVVRIVPPTEKIDQDAAGFLIGKGDQPVGRSPDIGYSVLLRGSSKRTVLIRDYGQSRFADGHRYHEAARYLTRLKQTPSADLATAALAHLEAIQHFWLSQIISGVCSFPPD